MTFVSIAHMGISAIPLPRCNAMIAIASMTFACNVGMHFSMQQFARLENEMSVFTVEIEYQFGDTYVRDMNESDIPEFFANVELENVLIIRVIRTI